ncbi:MAG: AAA family ATPase, partial [Calditrichae bacterium]|nr:AAA family ATPase [Calditrichia bacterium]
MNSIMSHTTFAPQIGHEHIQQKILHSVDHNRLSHAYLFYGPEGTGKDAFAISLAQLLNCGLSNGELDCESPQAIKIANLQHPDLKFVFPTPAQSALKEEDLVEALQEKARNPYQRLTFSGKNTFIGIDTIRELKREARFKLYEGKKKVFIISEADKMRVEAANALLKLLEEPPHNLMLILTTANIYKILPTIKSRCQLIKFSQLPQEKMETLLRQYGPDSDQRALSIIIRLSGGNIKKAFYFLEKDILQVREQAIELLRKVVVIERAQ